MKKPKFRIGSRASRLAMVQTSMVQCWLEKHCPGFEVEVIKISTEGDRKLGISLGELSGPGAFVKELEQALLEGRIDIAVHSLKDMTIKLPEGLMIGAVLERDDPRDVLVTRGFKFDELPLGSMIGTDSPRRAVQLLNLRPDLKVQTLRGNVETRIGRVTEGVIDGAVLAAAGLRRLGREEAITGYFPESFLPAPGQGAMAIEARQDDLELLEILRSLNHAGTAVAVTAERGFLAAMGGGCRAAVGALGTVEDGRLRLRGMFSPDHRHIVSDEIAGDPENAEKLGASLAEKMKTTWNALYPEAAVWK
ncbi:hydroxymethylbilane synthase [Dehalogenimonas formicexedens]|uniref:Porphobilinogen deaminase n=1 Tax=Dehalogenimonas formicexedens TaxID=1839801 RepID=A0A1P8F9I0_9CHLR|nr:hydroxymethylbilane synthase [Dehalogenimonas formicexedens]APV45105.1 hydroxymethylbilane synthase [Dehalogenimonas formicexedens]